MVAAMSLPSQNARRDRNERALVAEFGARGATCYRISQAGLPDLLVGYRRRWGLVEIKSARGKLGPLQVLFHTAAAAQGLHCTVVRNGADVERVLAEWGK